MPLITVIVVHDQSRVSHEAYLRGQKSLEDQTFRDFETLRYHDGPLLDPAARFQAPIACTNRRMNDWGHSLRDLGIREAKGEYIVHFNSENVLYPYALEAIAGAIQRPNLIIDDLGEPIDNNDVILFPVIRWGAIRFREFFGEAQGFVDFYLIFDGLMIDARYLDCMQVVMKRGLWLGEGGWSDRREFSHGEMYVRFLKKYGYRHIGPVLGETGPG